MTISKDTNQKVIDQKVINAINRLPGSMLEDIAAECPDLTWNQVFLTIDRLIREGTVRLTPKGRGLYTVHPLNVNPTQRAPRSAEAHRGNQTNLRPLGKARLLEYKFVGLFLLRSYWEELRLQGLLPRCYQDGRHGGIESPSVDLFTVMPKVDVPNGNINLLIPHLDRLTIPFSGEINVAA